MQFPEPLMPARLERRYKRFLADVTLADGSVAVAHCANPGSMLGLNAPGNRVWLLPSRNPKAKLSFGWELIECGGDLVGINTGRPNAVAAEAILAGEVPELAGYDALRREVRYGRSSRVDLLLEGAGRPPCYVEIKNVHLRRGAAAEFPDSVTARGAKHLLDLADRVAAGDRAVMFYLVQRMDCDRFAIAEDIDPAYAEGLRAAMARGVEVICYDCTVTLEGIALRRAVPLDLR